MFDPFSRRSWLSKDSGNVFLDCDMSEMLLKATCSLINAYVCPINVSNGIYRASAFQDHSEVLSLELDEKVNAKILQIIYLFIYWGLY